MVRVFSLRRMEGDDADLAQAILKRLRREGLYAPNLMYRGCAVAPNGLKAFRRYGTDRTPEMARQLFGKAVDTHVDILADMSEDDFLRHLSSEVARNEGKRSKGLQIDEETAFGSGVLWVLPEQGLERCIQGYTLHTPASSARCIPLVGVYRPEFLIRTGTPAHIYDGKLATDIPLDGLMDEDFACYKIKDGHTAKDAAVAGFQLPGGESFF